MGVDVSTMPLTRSKPLADLFAETMLWGAVAMGLTLLVGGILDMYAQEPGPNQRKFGSGVAAMTFLYTALFGATWLTTPWLYPTEVCLITSPTISPL